MRNKLLILAVLAVLILTALALQMRSEERVDELASRDLMTD